MKCFQPIVAGGHEDARAPIPSDGFQQSLQAIAGWRDSVPASWMSTSMITPSREAVTALPFGGDAGVGQRLQPGNQAGLVQRLGIAELHLALVRGQPVLGQQADHRLTAGIGPLQRQLPPLAGPDNGVRG